MENQKAKILYGINPKCTNEQIKKAAYLGLIPFVGFIGVHDKKVGRGKAKEYHEATVAVTIICAILAAGVMFLVASFDDAGSLAKMKQPFFSLLTYPFVAPFVAAVLVGITWHIPECINLLRISKNKLPIKNLELFFILVVLAIWAVILLSQA